MVRLLAWLGVSMTNPPAPPPLDVAKMRDEASKYSGLNTHDALAALDEIERLLGELDQLHQISLDVMRERDQLRASRRRDLGLAWEAGFSAKYRSEWIGDCWNDPKFRRDAMNTDLDAIIHREGKDE